MKKLAQPEVSTRRLFGIAAHFLVESLTEIVVVVFSEVGNVGGDAACELKEWIIGEIWGGGLKKLLVEGGENDLFEGKLGLGGAIQKSLLKVIWELDGEGL